MFLYPNPGKKVGSDMLKYFFDFKIGFYWMGDALTVPTIANFDHFKCQNIHFTHWSTVIMLSGDVFIPCKNYMDLFKYFLGFKVGFLGWMRP